MSIPPTTTPQRSDSASQELKKGPSQGGNPEIDENPKAPIPKQLQRTQRFHNRQELLDQIYKSNK